SQRAIEPRRFIQSSPHAGARHSARNVRFAWIAGTCRRLVLRRSGSLPTSGADPSVEIMPSKGMRLLTFLTGTEIMLAIAGLVAASALIASTSRLHRLAESISSAVESVYAAEQAGRALLVHSRTSNLHAVSRAPEHLQER